jgi:hypothetical protein
MCLIPNGYWDTVVWISRRNSVRYLFVRLDEQSSLKKQGGYTRWIGGSHFGCCCQRKETRGSAQTNNKRSSHTNCNRHLGWLWDFRKNFCELWQICHFCATSLSFTHWIKIRINRKYHFPVVHSVHYKWFADPYSTNTNTAPLLCMGLQLYCCNIQQ